MKPHDGTQMIITGLDKIRHSPAKYVIDDRITINHLDKTHFGWSDDYTLGPHSIFGYLDRTRLASNIRY